MIFFRKLQSFPVSTSKIPIHLNALYYVMILYHFYIATTKQKHTEMTTLSNINIEKSELPIYQECSEKIISNLERLLSSGRITHDRVSKILTMRWFLTEEVSVKEI
jgi:hypothetical protein